MNSLLSTWKEVFRTRRGCPCGGLWVSAGASVGESRPRMKTTNARMDDVQMGVASEWVGLSLRRGVGFGGCVRVRGVGQRTLSRIHGRKRTNGAQMEVHFGLGAAVRATGSGFRRACPWTPSMHGYLRHGLWRGKSRFWVGSPPAPRITPSPTSGRDE